MFSEIKAQTGKMQPPLKNIFQEEAIAKMYCDGQSRCRAEKKGVCISCYRGRRRGLLH